MKPLQKPFWILLSISLPQLILFFIFLAAYNVIGSLLSIDNLQYWFRLGIPYFGFGIAATSYALYVQYMGKQRRVVWWLSIIVLLLYLPPLLIFFLNINKVIPNNIPQWMLSQGDLLLYVITFSMPALLYAIALIVNYITPNAKSKRVWPSFLSAVLIPTCWYLFALVGRDLRVDSDDTKVIVIIIFILCTLLFIILLFRSLYIGLVKQKRRGPVVRTIGILIVGVLMPLAGLALNNNLFGSSLFSNLRSVFGDFSHPIFYGIALVNGLLLCVPIPSSKLWHLLLFAARAAGFSYIIYFFLVFMPYLPFSILAIIVFGLGFLMLTPLIVAFVQIYILYQDYNTLRKYTSSVALGAIGCIAFSILPISVLGSFFEERNNLHQALDAVYAYDPTATTTKTINKRQIKKSLKQVKLYKERDFIPFLNEGLPLLSPLRKYVVFDNLTLSNAKIFEMEAILLGESNMQWENWRQWNAPRHQGAFIDTIKTESTYNEQEEYYSTWLHFNISNDTDWLLEFTCSFNLPEGAAISNYYLDVNNQRKYGILAEKRSAMWVYQQITNQRRDPGIVYYGEDGRINMRVFPMEPNSNRTTGIEIIHRHPINLQIDSQQLQLGKPPTTVPTSNIQVLNDEQSVYFLDAEFKNALPSLERTPYYHFIVDVSKEAASAKNELVAQIEALLQENLTQNELTQFSFANYQTYQSDISQDWITALNNIDNEGGFFVEKAMSEALVNYLLKQNDAASYYPIFVVVSPFNLGKANFIQSLQAYKDSYPEMDYFYLLSDEGVFTKHLFTRPTQAVNNDSTFTELSIPPVTVKVFTDKVGKKHYLPANQQASMLIDYPQFLTACVDVKTNNKNWENAMLLLAQQKCLDMQPHLLDSHWLQGLTNSFKAQILSSLTTFMVVENEAQEKALLAKQQQVLKAKKSLSLGETDPSIMSEPSIFLLLFLLLIFYGFYTFKNSKQKRII